MFFISIPATHIFREESRSKLPKCDEEVFTRFLIAARPINSERRPRERPGHPRRSHNLTHFLFSSMSSLLCTICQLFFISELPPPRRPAGGNPAVGETLFGEKLEAGSSVVEPPQTQEVTSLEEKSGSFAKARDTPWSREYVTLDVRWQEIILLQGSKPT